MQTEQISVKASAEAMKQERLIKRMLKECHVWINKDTSDSNS